MQTQDHVWQSNFCYWQNSFVHQHILEIGYTAWNGFLTSGRGMVVCDVNLSVNRSVNWRWETVPHLLQFLGEMQSIAYLQQLELDTETIARLRQTIVTYNPSQSLIILMTGSGQIDINLLQHLAITPADCYAQVQKRWDEFPAVTGAIA